MNVIFLHILIGVTYGQLCIEENYTTSSSDVIANGSVISNTSLVSRIDCILLCHQTSTCVCLGYTPATGECILHDLGLIQLTIIPRNGSYVYERELPQTTTTGSESSSTTTEITTAMATTTQPLITTEQDTTTMTQTSPLTTTGGTENNPVPQTTTTGSESSYTTTEITTAMTTTQPLITTEQDTTTMTQTAPLTTTGGTEDNPEIRQWVAEMMEFSTEVGTPNYGAVQVVGPPDVYPAYGDNPLAWSQADQFIWEYVDVRYNETLFFTELNIYETYRTAPQMVKEVDLKHPTSGTFTYVWAVGDEGSSYISADIFNVPLRFQLNQTPYATNYIRVYVNTKTARGPLQIDAIEAVGFRFDPGP